MIYDLIIIGGGPAGLTAALYAIRQKIKVLLITKEFGGQLTRKSVAIENYPGFAKISGTDLIKRFRSQIKEQQILTQQTEVTSIEKQTKLFEINTSQGKVFKSKTVIIASGADPRPLEVPGEKEFIGKGVSYCTLCDAPLFKNHDVAVIGGGDAGVEAALALSNWANKIYILETNDCLTATPVNQEVLGKNSKIEVITKAILKEIQGNEVVNAIKYENSQNQEIKTLKVEGVFVQIGSQPATSFVKDLVDFNDKDEIIVDAQTSQTKTPGLFTAGDVDNIPYKQIVVAAGEGAKAAISVFCYLKKEDRT
jgi:NADH-dependent peroxiredoxin subunit F